MECVEVVNSNCDLRLIDVDVPEEGTEVEGTGETTGETRRPGGPRDGE